MMYLPDEIRELIEVKAEFYNRPFFIETDPVLIPHMFSKKEDIEISGLLTAIISWGQRKTIISNAETLMKLMDHEPYKFVMNAGERDMTVFKSFRHRTFNQDDLCYFLYSLGIIYSQYGGLEAAFGTGQGVDVRDRIHSFRDLFFRMPGLARTRKHIADPLVGSSAKRLNMFLRWMVRKDGRGVDFGIWKNIRPSELYCPLDVHSGSVARKLGLLERMQNDWKAVEELTANLRELDPDDPVKYDYALFGLGIFEKF